jgi:ABC-type microcin C transport system permease subunit YejE
LQCLSTTVVGLPFCCFEAIICAVGGFVGFFGMGFSGRASFFGQVLVFTAMPFNFIVCLVGGAFLPSCMHLVLQVLHSLGVSPHLAVRSILSIVCFPLGFDLVCL